MKSFEKRIKEIINRDKKNLKKGISIFVVLVVLLSTLAIKIVYSIANCILYITFVPKYN